MLARIRVCNKRCGRQYTTKIVELYSSLCILSQYFFYYLPQMSKIVCRFAASVTWYRCTMFFCYCSYFFVVGRYHNFGKQPDSKAASIEYAIIGLRERILCSFANTFAAATCSIIAMRSSYYFSNKYIQSLFPCSCAVRYGYICLYACFNVGNNYDILLRNPFSTKSGISSIIYIGLLFGIVFKSCNILF